MRTATYLCLMLFAALIGGCVDHESGLQAYGDCVLGERGIGRIVVTCTNSPFAERQAGERAVTARKVAEYVRDHEPKYKGAKDVTVQFANKKQPSKQTANTFSAAELGRPAQPAASSPPSEPNPAAPGDSATAPGAESTSATVGARSS